MSYLIHKTLKIEGLIRQFSIFCRAPRLSSTVSSVMPANTSTTFDKRCFFADRTCKKATARMRIQNSDESATDLGPNHGKARTKNERQKMRVPEVPPRIMMD
jgi:hypothetical protein